MKKVSGLGIPFSLTALALAIAAPVQATVIEELIVTVQKREQTMREIPVAVSTFDGEMMLANGVADLRGLVDLTPGFAGKTEDSFIDALSIRGIVTNDYGIGGDPSVAVFTDGVWAGRNGGVQMSFYDMWRAEVVKGPQSTLFGRNAIAGGINIVTNEPIDKQEGALNFTLAEDNEFHVDGMVNIPISDNWAFRAAGYFRTVDGWLDNTGGGPDQGASEVNSLRLGLKYSNDSMEAIFRVSYEDRRQDPSVYWVEAAGIAQDKIASDLGDEGTDESEITVVQANVTWELNDDLSLLSVTGFKTYTFNYVEDYDGTALYVNHYYQDQDVDYFSQEFRLVYQGDGDLSWFAGASVYQEDIDATFEARYNEDDLCIAIIDTDDDGGALGCDDPIFEAYWEDDIDDADVLAETSETNIDKLENRGWAVYGDISYFITEDLELTVGARYTLDKKDMSIRVLPSDGALGNNFNFEFFTNDFVQADDEWSEFTPRIAVAWQFNEDIAFYANAARGYKTGGYSTFGIDNDGETDDDGALIGFAEPLAFEPEISTSYEIGTKTFLLQNTMQLNLSYFMYDYKDLQLIIFESGSQLVRNVGEAENHGIEAELYWTPGEHWDIRVTYAVQDSEITKEIEEGDGTLGNALPMAPEVTASSIVTYSIPVTGGEFFVTGQWVYQDDMYGGPGNFELAKVEAWNQVDLRLGYNSDNEWSVTLWVENVTDELYFERGWENADEEDADGYGLYNNLTWPSRPTTVGLSVDMKF